MWERMNYYHLWMQGGRPADAVRHQPQRVLQPDPRINQLLHGIADGTMAHGEAWEFFQLGKYLERACQTARILDVKYHILLPTPATGRHADRQCPLGRHPDELLRLRAVPQASAAATARPRRWRWRTS